MKTIEVMLKALIEGHTLITFDKKDTLVIKDNKLKGISDYQTLRPDYWEIMPKKKWEDFIPNSGILCWVWDSPIYNPFIDLAFITKYNPENIQTNDEAYPYINAHRTAWKYAELFSTESAEKHILDIEILKNNVQK